MKQSKYSFRRRITIAYGVLIIVMLGILLAITVGRDKRAVSYGLGEYKNATAEWVDQNGMPFYFSHIDEYLAEGSNTVQAFYKPQENSDTEQSLMFRSKNAYVTVYLDGVMTYETDVANHAFYNHSPGTRWNLILLPPGTSLVELDITLAYDDGRAKIDNIFCGDRARILIEIIGNKIFGLFITLLILFVGIMFILAGIVLNSQSRQKDYGLIYLGIFAIIASLWCLLETNILQLFSPDLRILQVMDNMLLVVSSIPLFLYLDCSLGIGKNKFVRIICTLDICYIGLSTLSQMLGLWDYHQTLNGAVTGLALVSITGIIAVAAASIPKNRDGKRSRNYIPQQIGIIMIVIGLVGDLIRYLTSDVMDRAMIIRIGLLAFVICFGSGSMLTLIKLVEQGMQAEIISKLAYSDGLTEVGNRTAYIERLDKIAGGRNKRLGVVMLDINDLKKVNDTLGHGQGDTLIRVCSGIIQDSFGRIGEIFRIGGDEFIVLIISDNPEALYLEQYQSFCRFMKLENATGKYEYHVSIACGASFCVPDSKAAIKAAEEQADKLMYENKAYLKSMRAVDMGSCE